MIQANHTYLPHWQKSDAVAAHNMITITLTLACSAGVFWVGESLLIGFYDRGRLGESRNSNPYGRCEGNNMAPSRLKPFARAR